MSVVPFDRKRAVLEQIEAMSIVKRANDRNLARAQQQMVEAEESAKSYHMMDAFIKGTIADLIKIKRQLEQEEQNG